jgi:hypothetical protein
VGAHLPLNRESAACVSSTWRWGGRGGRAGRFEEPVKKPKLDDVEEAWDHYHHDKQLGLRVLPQRPEQNLSDVDHHLPGDRRGYSHHYAHHGSTATG